MIYLLEREYGGGLITVFDHEPSFDDLQEWAEEHKYSNLVEYFGIDEDTRIEKPFFSLSHEQITDLIDCNFCEIEGYMVYLRPIESGELRL